MSPQDSRLSRFLFYCLLLIVAWLPLPFGSKPQWAMGLLQVSIFALSAMWVLAYSMSLVSFTPTFRKGLPVVGGFFLVTLWVWVQSWPLPATLVQFLSPVAWSAQTEVAHFVGAAVPDYLYLSLDPFATRVHGLLSASYALLFSLMLLLVTDSRRLKVMAWLFVIAGTFQAVFGSLSTLSGAEVLLFGPKETGQGVASGTFVNRNNFAGCLEMTLAVGMGLLIAQLNDRKAGNFGEWLRQTLATLMSSKVILRTALAIMVIGLVMSRSRMGNTAFFSSLFITGFIYVICQKKLTRSVFFLFASLILIDTLIISKYFGLEKLIDRLENTVTVVQVEDSHLNEAEIESLVADGRREGSAEGLGNGAVESDFVYEISDLRTDVNPVTLEMIPDFSLTGSGAGTFYTTLPSYHDGTWTGFFDLAHNDFFQFPLEFGMPAFILLVLMVLVSLWHSVKAMLVRRSRIMIGMGFASFMGLLSLLIHSSVDFNLQIPSNAAYFVCLMAFAWLARYLPSSKLHRTPLS